MLVVPTRSYRKLAHIISTATQRLGASVESNPNLKMLLNGQISSKRHRPPALQPRTCKILVHLLSMACALLLIYSSSSRANQRQGQPPQQANRAAHRNQSATTARQPHVRPLDRPSLALATSNYSASAPEIPEGAADWFMMGGGDLMMPDEGRSVAAFADGGRPNASVKSTRRMAEVRQHRKQAKGANKTIFDDEQSSDATDANEIYDDAEDSAAMAGTQKEPECAGHGRYYCTFKEDYPLKLVTEVTKYYKWPLEKLFRDLHAQIMPKLAQDSTGNLVCDSITRVVRPGWARNTNDRWLVVINTDNYHQYVTEVVCQYGTNSRCNFIPPCYYSSCQQRYNTQKLLVIDPTNPYRGPFLSEFLFPSCCVCYVPSSSDTFKDNYRSSPATIYQRTMQQEAASNLHPPQYRPAQISLLEEAFGSASNVGGQLDAAPLAGGSSRTAASASVSQPQTVGATGGGGGGISSSGAAGAAGQLPAGGKTQPLGPGEIRRAGEQYRRQLEQQFEGEARQGRRHELGGGGGGGGGADSFSSNELATFPRLGLSDSLLSLKGAPKE